MILIPFPLLFALSASLIPGGLSFLGGKNQARSQGRRVNEQYLLEQAMMNAIGGDPLLAQILNRAMSGVSDPAFNLAQTQENAASQINQVANRRQMEGQQQLAGFGLQSDQANVFTQNLVDQARAAQLASTRDQIQQAFIQSQPQALVENFGQLSATALERLGSEVGVVT